jgi:hypothetical protein
VGSSRRRRGRRRAVVRLPDGAAENTRTSSGALLLSGLLLGGALGAHVAMRLVARTQRAISPVRQRHWRWFSDSSVPSSALLLALCFGLWFGTPPLRKAHAVTKRRSSGRVGLRRASRSTKLCNDRSDHGEDKRNAGTDQKAGESAADCGEAG